MANQRKISMFSNGKVVAYLGDGNMEPATEQEVAEHLASYLPKTYKGEELKSVMFNPEDGKVYGKYATKTVRKKVFAQDSTNQTEPVDGPQKVKDTNVPRDDSKAKPQENKKIVKDRPDVGNPTEVRNKDYQRGEGGEDLHSDEVPRSKDDSGLKGKDKTDFEEEKANKATSDNPDEYVQKLNPSEKPEKAGTEKNHVADKDIQFRSEAEIYPNLKLSEKEEDKSDEKDGATKLAKTHVKDQSSKRKLPWETAGSDAQQSTEKQAGNYKKLYAEAQKELQEKEAEINRYRIREARKSAAIKYALALYKLNPAKYAEADTFDKVVEDAASKMTVDTIEEAIEALKNVQKEADSSKATKTASKENETDEGLATALYMEADPVSKTAKKDQSEELKGMLMESSKIGKMMAEYDKETA